MKPELPGTAGRILATRNDPITNSLLTAIAEQLGHAIDFLESDTSLMAHALDVLPDLIVISSGHAGADGFALCRGIRAHRSLRDLPVLMITAEHEQSARIMGLEAGVDDFISKPFEVAELEARLKSILRLNRFRTLTNERLRFEYVARNSPEGVVIINIQGRIRFSNTAARRALHLGETDPPPGSFFDLAEASYEPRPRESWAAFRGQPGTEVSELVLVSRGRGMQAAYRVQAYMLAYTLERELLVFIRDVTEQYANTHLLWSLRGTVSHKLRTPLNGILGSFALCEDGMEQLSAEDLREIITLASSSARRLASVLDDMEAFFNARGANRSCPCCTLAEAVRLAASLAQTRGVAIEQEPPGKDPASNASALGLSHEQLEAILGELLANSIRFHPKNAPRLRLRWLREGQQLRLSFEDDGIHLPERQLRRLAQPFFQVENDHHTGELSGGGLGLAAIARTLWSIGGDLRAGNRTDKPGLCLTLTIPLRETEPASADAAPASPPAAQG